ncbi:NERD domain-containing protein [Bacillus lacus]|uniref:NERD domain-containing protein n=1 Tax=Metabacillus lacus TaxID=1983721 RepID=A0A7X2J070_9BACI|nr:NERD domain-containing protein [Metabacillus lacus]MRX72702.1 NERD domain-containing protein [Metabacillus lacus]
MAQLIKLADYITRYETDIYRYPGQFIRLKKQQWKKTFSAWEEGSTENLLKQKKLQLEKMPPIEKEHALRKFRKLFKKKYEETKALEAPQILEDSAEDSMEFAFASLPNNEKELKQLFLDHIFDFQLKWASSTIFETSSVDSVFKRDSTLKYFLQTLPDQYLLLYRPVFQMKKASVELEIILISPREILCITMLEGQDNALFVESKDHFWLKKAGGGEKKVLNPYLSLNRMGNIVSSVLHDVHDRLPVKKMLLSRNGYIEANQKPFDVDIIDKRNFQSWYNSKKSYASPIKHNQLKCAKSLLIHCRSNGWKRTEWNRTPPVVLSKSSSETDGN